MKILHLPSGQRIIFGQRSDTDNEFEYSLYIWPEDLYVPGWEDEPLILKDDDNANSEISERAPIRHRTESNDE